MQEAGPEAPNLELIESLIERPVEIDPELKADFPTSKAEEVCTRGDMFNDLGRNFPRDTRHLADNMDDLIAMVNKTEFNEYIWSGLYLACCIFSLGAYYFMKRRVIPPGKLGHFVSLGRHFLVNSGLHNLMTFEASWLDDEDMDHGEAADIREFGMKTLLAVPENHVAGAFRIGKEGGDEENKEDGEFVLLGQGRHILDSAEFRELSVSKLEGDKVKVGPVTVLYIREGWIGGAYERDIGKYRLLHPGPPMLLHSKDWEEIDMVERNAEQFTLGPIQFLTVREGYMGGAYVKSTGNYQLLPPGSTYQLHSKNFEEISLVKRSNFFKLGPFTFVTVQRGQLCGAFRKKFGDFIMLPPGKTYQLNEDDFDEPVRVRRSKHVVECGPLTFVTLQEGVLTGAYRTRDGRFEEFEPGADGRTEFVLHERDYYGLTTVDKYSREVQEFGPNKIVTIPEGSCGVFEREGVIQIKDPGFYKVSVQYRIRENIPLEIYTDNFMNKQFRTKDAVVMSTNFMVVWCVSEPTLVARWPGSLAELTDCLKSKVLAGIGMILKQYNRAQLMPTSQDVAGRKPRTDLSAEEKQALLEKMQKAERESKEILESVEASTNELMNNASSDGAWGLKIISVRLDALEIADDRIIMDLQSIAQSQLSSKRKQMQGKEVRASQNVKREAEIQKAQTHAEIEQCRAESESRVKLATAEAMNEVNLMEATSQAKAQAEAKSIEFEMQQQLAENRAAMEDMRMQQEQRKAETEANSILLMSNAEFERGCQGQEVAGKISHQELELRRIRLIVNGLKHYGKAAWRYPEEMHNFIEQLRPYLRLSVAKERGLLEDGPEESV